MVIQRSNASHPAGTVISLVIPTEIVPREKTEEEVRVEEEEEISPTLGKEDSHLKEGDIRHIQKEKARRRETEATGLEMTVQVSKVQTKTGPVGLGHDLILAQRQNKTLHQEEKSQKGVEDQTETKADTIRVIEW